MGAIVACFGLLVGSVVIFLSFLIKDEVGTQSIGILGVLIFMFSFPLAPLFVKLGLIALLVIGWPYIGDRLSLSFYRQLKK